MSGPFAVTWLNHHSALRMSEHWQVLKDFDLIGVDGLFLKYILRKGITRTSADLLLPRVFSEFNLSVILVGGEAENLESRLTSFETKFPKLQVLGNLSGFESRVELTLEKLINKEKPDVVVLGLGSPKQDSVAMYLKESIRSSKRILIVTCGGWLDQLQHDKYYPSWAYPLRINWLIRLLREPKRLWRRYTLEPILFSLNRTLIKRLRELTNLK
jgi:exopolysaccharide biosynthesis WecB/TagA/CpsF family protein